MKALAALLTLSLAACGGSDGNTSNNNSTDNTNNNNNDNGSGGDTTKDTTAPTVVSITPADGATGVRSDAVIVVEFTEPMDRLSVQDGLDTSDLGGVQFSWSDDGTTVTIAPDAPLDYADGFGINPEGTEAKQYQVTVRAGCTDEAGNSLASDVQSTFSTLKSITAGFERDNGLTGSGTPEGIVTTDTGPIKVGDDGNGGISNALRGYITIDLSPLPDTAVEIVSATLADTQSVESNNPYTALGDGTGLLIDHVSYTVATGDFATITGNEANAAFNTTPLAELGVFANSGDTDLSMDVTSQVQDDFAHRVERSNRSQYRLRFSTYTDLDDLANAVYLVRNDVALKVVYLAP